MKLNVAVALGLLSLVGISQAMTTVDTPTAQNSGQPAAVSAGGRVEVIHAGAGKMVIGGTTYTYSPLHTVVTINAKRATISDLRVGERVQFQAGRISGSSNPSLTSISVER